jgi:hypothetical protein
MLTISQPLILYHPLYNITIAMMIIKVMSQLRESYSHQL